METTFFGANVRRLRKQQRLTLAQMAANLSINLDALSKIERGERRPSLGVAVEIARVLGVGVDELLTGQKLSRVKGVDTACQ